MNGDLPGLVVEEYAPPLPERVRAVLASPELPRVIAALELLRECSPDLRGDGKVVGWPTFTDGLPLLFALGVWHGNRDVLAVAAGIHPEPPAELREVECPPRESIDAEKARLRAVFVASMRRTADMLERGT